MIFDFFAGEFQLVGHRRHRPGLLEHIGNLLADCHAPLL